VVGSMGLLTGKGGCEFWSMKLASPSLEGVDVGGREYKGEELSSRTLLVDGAALEVVVVVRWRKE